MRIENNKYRRNNRDKYKKIRNKMQACEKV